MIEVTVSLSLSLLVEGVRGEHMEGEGPTCEKGQHEYCSDAFHSIRDPLNDWRESLTSGVNQVGRREFT